MNMLPPIQCTNSDVLDGKGRFRAEKLGTGGEPRLGGSHVVGGAGVDALGQLPRWDDVVFHNGCRNVSFQRKASRQISQARRRLVL